MHTTTTTLLASTMIADGFNAIKAGSNAVEVKRGIEQATKEVIAKIKEISNEIVINKQKLASLNKIHFKEVLNQISDKFISLFIYY